MKKEHKSIGSQDLSSSDKAKVVELDQVSSYFR